MLVLHLAACREGHSLEAAIEAAETVHAAAREAGDRGALHCVGDLHALLALQSAEAEALDTGEHPLQHQACSSRAQEK